MLHLIKGRAGSGKTEMLRKILKENICNNKNTLLLIPEQFSFETDRAILKEFGPKLAMLTHIYSFPRMALSELENVNSNVSNIANNGVKNAVMSETLSQIQDELTVFKNLKHNFSAISPLVDFCKEMKYYKLNDSIINEKFDKEDNSFLKEKIKELSFINTAYSAQLTQSYFDDADMLDYFVDFAVETGYFKNKTVFLDGFRSFNKQESECVKVILSQADDVYITLCVDGNSKPYTALRYIKLFENKLRALSNEVNASVDEILCEQKKTYFSEDISHLEKNIYSNHTVTKQKCNGDIVVTECKDLDEECKYVAATVKKILQSGEYRAKDIVIIERTGGVYKKHIVNALKRLSIPVFDDSRRPLLNETLIIYIMSVLECAALGFTTERLMTYLKTGLTDIAFTDVLKLEKYALVWGINGTSWLKDFTMNPQGFGKTLTPKDKALLNELNEIRKKVVIPLEELKKSCSDVDGKEISKLVYEFLIDLKVKDKLYDLAVSLEESGLSLEAQRQENSWNMLMSIIDNMANLTQNKFISLKRWYELFSLLVSSNDMGEIPQGLDEVRICDASRFRVENIKIAFLMGVNKDEFPLVFVPGGVLTDAERVKLKQEYDIEFQSTYLENADEERFISYCAVTTPRDRLYLTYKTSDGAGTALYKSEIIDAVEECFEDFKINSAKELPEDYFIESEDTLFTAFCQNYFNNTELKATLFEYLSGNNGYSGKLSAVDAVSGKSPIVFRNENVSKKLFEKNIHISASKVENFYNCPFAYFMRYGLNAEPLKEAELDPAQSGTVIHLVMESILNQYSISDLLNLENETLRSDVEKILSDYLQEKMGGIDEKSSRFMFLYNRLTDTSLAVLERIRDEFKIGEFKPVDYELKIGDENIPAYELPLDDGKVTVTGSVDRVDLMEKDGIKYLRVIDYKTGKKEFKLSELLEGLNIQMVLYLMALLKNGKKYYGDAVPAGVLYLPSRIGISNYLSVRNPSSEAVQAQKTQSGKLSGMILNSPVVFNGMGVDKLPSYFPVGYKKDGSAKGNYYSQHQFKSLSKIIDEKIIYMGNALHQGKISPIPIGRNDEGFMCKYCSYKSTCMHEYSDEVKNIEKLGHSEVLNMLGGEDNE
ncbi:MAG: PD-(D/E)XK nuclease family protein [Acutalibacteraceae bacterium]